MDEGDSAIGVASQLARAKRARVAERLPLAYQHRRRRAGALATVAILALLAGAVVGAASGAGGAAARSSVTASHGYLARLKALPGRGAGSVAAEETRDENAAINRTLAYTPYVRIAGSQHREVALTFDDGPGPYTPDIIRELERGHTPATFFEVGVLEKYFQGATAALVARGFPIGDHTELHAPMSHLSRRDQRTQLLEDAAAIGAAGAPFPRMFRPPYGLWDSTTLSLLKRYRMLMVLWSVDTDDYQQPGVATIVQRALAGARPGAIILLHDAGGTRSETVAALPQVIRGLRARSYKLVTVPRLLLDNPAPHDQDVGFLQGSGG
ncbi:MAG TPA: polysaccharide deacetylase family protein [Solirubrobacteraceae bacterium]|nr:polysaccharide deacetylase family protein [Solirubrobacteraceae bacterium]